MKLLRFSAGGGGIYRNSVGFSLFCHFSKLTVLDIEEKNCKTVRMRQTSNTKLEAKTEKREKKESIPVLMRTTQPQISPIQTY